MSQVTIKPIQFFKPYEYNRRVPTLLGTSTSGNTEITKWVLDINQILHDSCTYPPVISDRKRRAKIGSHGTYDTPVLFQTDKVIYTAESIIQDYDQTLPEEKKLFPTEETLQKEVYELYYKFTTTLQVAIEQYRFSELFSCKKNVMSLVKKDASFLNKLKYKLAYGGFKKTISERLELNNQDSVVFLIKIQQVFDEVNELLADGRKYLTGNKFTAADLAFAAIASPLILPVEYGGALSHFNEINEEYRQEVFKLRATPAGQFVLKMYQEERPINLNLGPVPKRPNWFKRQLNRLIIKLTSNQGALFYWLQKRLPLINIGIAKLSIASRQDIVVDILDRDEDFTVKEINSKKMADQKGTFFLGMDKNNPQFDRERNLVRKASKREDVQQIQEYVKKHADEICKRATPYGKLDVVQTLNYEVLIGILDSYFGVPAPVKSQMKRWQRTMFYDLFLNLFDNHEKHLAAVNSGKERTAWVRGLIDKRKKELADGKTLKDNLLNRLIILQQEPEQAWLDDDTIRRQIGGLMTGLQETTSKAVIFSLQELFKHPKELRGAIEAAKTNDIETLRGYVYEGLRFNPVQPGVIRFSETKQYIEGKNNKRYRIKGNRKVLTLTSGAMFDPVTFTSPKKFIPNRDSRYMNWGFGLHECFGKYINAVTIPELVAAVLRLENVQLAPGDVGRGSGLKMGPFPNNFVVTFKSKND